jgi:hypothetical protein
MLIYLNQAFKKHQQLAENRLFTMQDLGNAVTEGPLLRRALK